MVESDAQADVWADLETVIEAFEGGLDEYQTQFHAWSQARRTLVAHEAAMAEERTSASVRGLEERAQQLARDQEALAQDKAGLERFRAELDAFAAECDRRERVSCEREHSLGQKYSSHEETAASLQVRTKQLDLRQCEIQGRFEKSQQDLEERKSALAGAEKEIAEQRKQLDRDHQELTHFRDELARRESELASQSVANKDTQEKLTLLGAELEAMRESVEAELAATRQESTRKEAESLARRNQVERDQISVEQRAQSLDRRSEEVEWRSKTIAEREGELNGQQAKLEAAMQSLRNDQTAIEKARSAVIEVDESHLSELNKVRSELHAMRRENELARARERELEGSLGKVQAANAREMHAAEEARTEAARLTEQLEDEKRTAAEQRAAIFAQCLIAAGLKGSSADGEHEVLALLEGVKTKSVGLTALVVTSPNDSRVVGLPSDGGTLLVQRQASHTAVATFWADFKPAPSHAGPASTVSAGTKTVVADTTATQSQTTSSLLTRSRHDSRVVPLLGAQECATEEAVDTQASAMRTALASARAEVEAAKHKERTAARSGPKAKALSNGRKRKAGNAPVQFTRETAQKPAPELVAKQPAAVSASIDLDPETANRLRMMRRLNPTKSDQELLAKISAEEKNPARVKQKKGWFALR